jgi:hypothetical protein
VLLIKVMGLANKLDVLDRRARGESCASVTRLVGVYEPTARTIRGNEDSLQQMNEEKYSIQYRQGSRAEIFH